jgi:molecular chaperone GrpE (heat shock protein)
MDPNNKDTAGVRKNAWMNKSSPQIVYDTDFPAWVGGQTSRKKARQNQRTQQPKETETLGTSASDENTKMNTKISLMQSDFTKRLESITKQSQEIDRATKKLIKDPETKQASANQQLLNALL